MTVILVSALLLACGRNGEESAIPGSRPPMRVTVAQPQQRDIDYVLTALGSVESIQRPTLSAETAGQVMTLEVDEGDAVAAGSLLLALDDSLHSIESDKAAAELFRAEVLLDNQGKEVERLQRLAQTQSVSRDQLEDEQAQLQMLKAQRDVARGLSRQALHHQSKTRIVAPQDGRISRRHVSIGDYVVQGQPLFDLVSVEILQARLAFPEHEAGRIETGQEVWLTSPAAPETVAIGEVTQVNPLIDMRNRAIEVIVRFENPGGWHPGASVDATVVIRQVIGALTLPAHSIVQRERGRVAYVVEGDHVAQRLVELGWREEDWVEVTRGLQADNEVVVEGAALLTDGSRVEAVRNDP
jgi:RND family efflux transporter MFP subunit